MFICCCVVVNKVMDFSLCCRLRGGLGSEVGGDFVWLVDKELITYYDCSGQRDHQCGADGWILRSSLSGLKHLGGVQPATDMTTTTTIELGRVSRFIVFGVVVLVEGSFLLVSRRLN